jgi:hypothetical protein
MHYRLRMLARTRVRLYLPPGHRPRSEKIPILDASRRCTNRLAHADLAPFVEALFDRLAALLERPVFACCDSPQPDPAGTCQACGAELTDDQLRALSTAPISPWPTYPPASGRRVLTVGWSGARPWPRSTSSITSCPTAAPLPALPTATSSRASGARPGPAGTGAHSARPTRPAATS